MNVLITGACGFIGSHLADHLLGRDNHVCGIDNLTTGQQDNLSDQAELLLGDIASEAEVAAAFEQADPDVVIHCAASYKDPADWRTDVLTNALGTANVVRACQEHRVRRLVYFQTALCYGTRPRQRPVNLDHPLEPDSSYAISKTAAEHYIAISGLDFVSFRLANIYGPRNVSGPIPTFFRKLKAGETCTVVRAHRDFVYIDDLIDAVIPAVLGELDAGYYHVASGQEYPILQVYRAVADALGVDDDPNVIDPGADDAVSIYLNPGRLARTGWRAETPLRDGVEAAVEWYTEHGVGETYTHLSLPR